MLSKQITYFSVALCLLFVLSGGTSDDLVSAEINPTSTNQENNSNTQSSTTYQYYLPLVNKPVPGAQFSIGGVGMEEQVLQVVPEDMQIDPYIWDVFPLVGSSIQTIRACTYYRARTFINDGGNWRWTHTEWYSNHKIGHLCWDPITEQIAKIVTDNGCPYGEGRACLSISVAGLEDSAEIEFRQYAQAHPEWTWLIGNEPDGYSQDALLETISLTDGVNERTIHLGGPTAYARFFKGVYKLIDAEINTTPKLVFCQATFAHEARASYGLAYCRQAYDALKAIGFGPAHIYAISTHQYVHDAEIFNGRAYVGGQLLDGETQPYNDGQTLLELAVGKWIDNLESFEAWAASEGMGDKPLWLTEYGSLAAWCTTAQADSNYESGGVACPEADNGQRLYPFYGRNSGEGLWGLQKLQMEYLMRSDNQWKAGWWFVSTMGWGSGACYQTGWLWRADFDCEADSSRTNNLSRAGETHYQVLNCLFHKQNCPTAGKASNASDMAMPIKHSSVPIPEPQCKSFGDFICPNELE
ncbi:MAG: hypothetical protein ACPG8W_21160 [Candidatus Promineifilaceae bacterium]